MSMDDVFAEAVERIKAGEPLAAVVASYPADVQVELADLLTIVELTEEVAVQPLPQRSSRQRALARAQFLQQAGALRAEMEETLGAAVTPPAAATAAGRRNAARRPTWRERLSVGWGSLFDAPLLRLAPLAAVVAAVYLAMFWTVRTAEAALPGDVVYPIKQWVREQKVNLAPPDQRPYVQTWAETQVFEEAKTLATAADTRRDARAALAALHEEQLTFYGRRGDLLQIGPFLVAPNYQPDPTQEEFTAMDIKGVLEPGVTVRLVYKLLPGTPSVVQGVTATVLTPPRPTPPPTVTPAPDSFCQVTLPQGWVPYPVQAGDTLPSLAGRAGASVETIRRVNCLGDSLRGVNTIMLPGGIYVEVTPPSMPTALPTAVPTLTPVPTETATPEPTATPRPPTTEPTDLPPDATPDATPGEPTATPTDEPGGSTPAATPAATPTDVPTATATAEPTGSPTAEPTAATATPALTLDTTPGATPQATLPETPTDAPTVAATPTEEATAPATVAPTLEPTAPPTSAPTEPPAALPTEPPPTQPPPTQPPPTQARPTPVPPTPVPPTPVPPTPVPPTPVPPTPVPPTEAPASGAAPPPADPTGFPTESG